MKIRSKKLLAGLVGALCLFAFIISPVSASGMMGMGAGSGSADGGGDCDQTRDQLNNQTCDPVRDQIRDPLNNQTCDPVRDQIRDQLNNQTCDPVRDQIRDQQMVNRPAMAEDRGFRATEISVALKSGDMETLRGLFAEIRGVCKSEGALNCYGNGNVSGPRLGPGFTFSRQASVE